MKGLMTLVQMQLKERLDFSFLNSTKQMIFKAAFFTIGIILITAAFSFMFYFSIVFKLLTNNSRLPITVLVFVFTLMQLLSIATTTVGLMKALYFSGDNTILLTTPVTANTVFFSKLIVFYICEIKKNITYMLPLFIAFGLINKFNLAYYPLLLISFLVLSLIPVALGACLSIPASFVASFLRDKKILQIALATIITTAAIFFFFRLAAMIPQNIDLVGMFGKHYWRIQDFLKSFSKFFAPQSGLIEMVTGKYELTWHRPVTLRSCVIFLCVIVTCVALFFVAFMCAKPLFFKMASKPYEFNFRKVKGNKSNKKLAKYISSLKKEVLFKLRTPSLLVQSLISVFLLPFAIFLLNKIFAALDTRLTGNLIAISFNFFLTILILLSGNIQIAAVFSSEGKAVAILKTTPESVKANIAAKLTFAALFSTISVILTTVIIASANSLSLMQACALGLSIICLNAGHIFWSAELDIVNPQYNNIIGGANLNSNPNETKSVIFAFAVCFIMAVIFTFLIFEDRLIVWYKILALSIIFFTARIYLLMTNAKVYFKEM